MQSTATFLVVPGLWLTSAQNIATSNTNVHEDNPFRGSSKSDEKAHKRNRRRRLYNLSTSFNSACEPDELSFGMFLQTAGKKQAKISWSVESSDGAVTQSSPLVVSHASVYNQELCFDEMICHRFTLNDTSTPTFPFQNEDGVTSIRISINGLTVLESPEHTLSSFSFKFGQCESMSSKSDVYPSPTIDTEPEISQSPSPAPSSRLRSAHAHEQNRNGQRDNNQISKRCETEILIIITLLLFVAFPRISSLFCCLTAIIGAKKYMNSDVDEEEDKRHDDDDATANSTSHSFDESNDKEDTIEEREGLLSHLQSFKAISFHMHA